MNTNYGTEGIARGAQAGSGTNGQRGLGASASIPSGRTARLPVVPADFSCRTDQSDYGNEGRVTVTHLESGRKASVVFYPKSYKLFWEEAQKAADECVRQLRGTATSVSKLLKDMDKAILAALVHGTGVVKIQPIPDLVKPCLEKTRFKGSERSTLGRRDRRVLL